MTPEEQHAADAGMDDAIRDELVSDTPGCPVCATKEHVRYIRYTHTCAIWKCNTCKTLLQFRLPGHLYKRK